MLLKWIIEIQLHNGVIIKVVVQTEGSNGLIFFFAGKTILPINRMLHGYHFFPHSAVTYFFLK